MQIEPITSITKLDLSTIHKILSSDKITEAQKSEFVKHNQTKIHDAIKSMHITGAEFKSMMKLRPLRKFKFLKNSFTKRGDKILLAETLGIEPSEVDGYIENVIRDIEEFDDLSFLPQDKMDALKTYVYRHGSKSEVVNFLDYELRVAKDTIKELYNTLEYHTGGMADFFIRPVHRMDKNTFKHLYNVIDKHIKRCEKEGFINEADSEKIAKWALVKLYLIRNNSQLINAIKTYKELSE